MKYSIKDYPAHLTMVGELNGTRAYEAAGRAVRAYPPFVTVPETVVGDELFVKKSFVDVVVYPELFVVIGEDVGRGQGGAESILGYGISLAMSQQSLVKQVTDKGGSQRDIGCVRWYQMQSDGTRIIGGELVENLDIGKCKMTLRLGEKEVAYDMADMIWKPEKILPDMSQLARFRKYDRVFLGPVDAPTALGREKKVVVKNDCFDDLEVVVRYEK